MKRHLSLDCVRPDDQIDLSGLSQDKGVDKQRLSQTKKKKGKHDCVLCTGNSDMSPYIRCESCDQVFHLKCCGVIEKDNEIVTNLIDLLGWTCKACREQTLEELDQLRVELAAVDSKLQTLMTQLNKRNTPQLNSLLTTAVTTSSSSSDSSSLPGAMVVDGGESGDTNELSDVRPAAKTTAMDYSAVVRIVNRSVKNAGERRKNIIVSGMKETASNKEADMFIETCRMHMGLCIDKARIKATKRLGKEGVNPRKCLVRFDSDQLTSDILSKAKLLRSATDKYTAKYIYLNPDLSKEEAKMAYDKRQERRNKASNPSKTSSTNVAEGPGINVVVIGEVPPYQYSGQDFPPLPLPQSTSQPTCSTIVSAAGPSSSLNPSASSFIAAISSPTMGADPSSVGLHVCTAHQPHSS